MCLQFLELWPKKYAKLHKKSEYITKTVCSEEQIHSSPDNCTPTLLMTFFQHCVENLQNKEGGPSTFFGSRSDNNCLKYDIILLFYENFGIYSLLLCCISDMDSGSIKYSKKDQIFHLFFCVFCAWPLMGVMCVVTEVRHWQSRDHTWGFPQEQNQFPGDQKAISTQTLHTI